MGFCERGCGFGLRIEASTVLWRNGFVRDRLDEIYTDEIWNIMKRKMSP